MEDKIQAFRQPMVTATGIMLGFILNFASIWVKADSHLSDGLAYLVGICIIIGVVCLIIVLSRVLRIDYPKDKAEKYYNATLRIFIIGVCFAFVGVIIDLYGNFMVD